MTILVDELDLLAAELAEKYPKGVAHIRKQTLEEAAKFVEENYEEPFVNIVGNPSWRERGPKKLAAAIRALKDKP